MRAIPVARFALRLVTPMFWRLLKLIMTRVLSLPAFRSELGKSPIGNHPPSPHLNYYYADSPESRAESWSILRLGSCRSSLAVTPRRSAPSNATVTTSSIMIAPQALSLPAGVLNQARADQGLGESLII